MTETDRPSAGQIVWEDLEFRMGLLNGLAQIVGVLTSHVTAATEDPQDTTEEILADIITERANWHGHPYGEGLECAIEAVREHKLPSR